MKIEIPVKLRDNVSLNFLQSLVDQDLILSHADGITAVERVNQFEFDLLCVFKTSCDHAPDSSLVESDLLLNVDLPGRNRLQ